MICAASVSVRFSGLAANQSLIHLVNLVFLQCLDTLIEILCNIQSLLT